MKINLSAIYIYPIKSVSGVSVKESFAGERGLEFDRRWMLIDEHNMFITQRQYREMALIDLEIDGNNMVISHRNKDVEAIKIPLIIHKGGSLQAKIWKDEVNVIWPGLKADAWFSDILNNPCKLVYMPNDSSRQVDPEFVTKSINTGLSDGYPYLLTNTRSLRDVMKKSRTNLDMQRFRANFVVDGSVAYEEDSWKRIKIGDVIFELVKPCARCTITTINPTTSETGKEPLNTLATYRKKNNKILFGQNMIVVKKGRIQAGEDIEILA